MAGIYIHIPFCRRACHYCDFHFSTSWRNKNTFLSSIKKEIFLQKDYLHQEEISTIYFGGGTPSVLSVGELSGLFNELYKHFSIHKDVEITLEANPDDLSPGMLKELSKTPVNRLSIGIQSLRDEDLRFLNRVHNAFEAIQSVEHAQEAGFSNITVDLIYGIQTLTNTQWINNLSAIFSLKVPHVSCYSLTVEPATPLHSFIQKGEMPPTDSKKSVEQFEILMKEMKENHFIHYEISNFCKEGFYSRHNSNYWKGESYLGLGPSAHSYNGHSRQWNIKSNAAYIGSIDKNVVPYEKEILTEVQQYNEYILTSLRTIWGLDSDYIRQSYPENIVLHFEKELRAYFMNDLLVMNKNTILLTDKGKLFADKIASDFFFVG